MRISFYLYFPESRDAQAAGETLRGDGYAVDIRPSADEVNWLVLAEGEREPDALDDLEQAMSALAAEHDGEYDGYERAIG